MGSALFSVLVVWRLRGGTGRASVTGAAITACLMFANTSFPYEYSWLHGGLIPLLAVFLLTFIATKLGRARKQQLGSAESSQGRDAGQVAANLGMAALVVVIWPLMNLIFRVGASPLLAYAAALAALAEAAADTVSSEIGQVVGSEPRLITSLQKVAPGTDGGVTLAGTAIGVVAALLVAAAGQIAMQSWHGSWLLFKLAAPGAIFGLLFDSLLGATLERKGWLNNNAVNFLSTLSASVFCVIQGIVWSRLLSR